jgi:hypothetical protein
MNPYYFNFPSAIGSQTGDDFCQSIIGLMPGQHRDDLVMAKICSDGLPEFMKTPVEITVSENGNILKYYATPDYICIGTDSNYVRMPIMAKTMRALCDKMNMALSTRKMVNQVWNAAQAKMIPSPNGPPYTEVMGSITKLLENENRIRLQLENVSLGTLVSGIKKDVVNAKALTTAHDRLGIYGWIKKDSTPIQGLNCVSHNAQYVDYSQTLRGISRTMLLNGNEVDFYDIIKDQNLCSLISDEGPYDASNIYG